MGFLMSDFVRHLMLAAAVSTIIAITLGLSALF